MQSLWGSGPDDVYFGGTYLAESSSANTGALYHRTADGAWSAVDLSAAPTLFSLNRVWGNSPTNVYVGGRFAGSPGNGALLQGTAH
jgi:hypothetical protein